jgi:deoxycytidylate deaminase
MNDDHLFKIARECSLKSDYTSRCSSAKIGCVIIYKNAILAKSFNSDKTHTIQAKYNKWRYNPKENTKYLPSKIHAELASLQKIKYLDIDFSKVHIYIYRETKKGEIAMARPCPSCLAAIKELGIRHIHYTSDSGYCYERIIK